MSCCRKFPPGNGESYDGNNDDDGDDNDEDDGDAVKSSQKCSRHLCEVVFVSWVPSSNISRHMLAVGGGGWIVHYCSALISIKYTITDHSQGWGKTRIIFRSARERHNNPKTFRIATFHMHKLSSSLNSFSRQTPKGCNCLLRHIHKMRNHGLGLSRSRRKHIFLLQYMHYRNFR